MTSIINKKSKLYYQNIVDIDNIISIETTRSLESLPKSNFEETIIIEQYSNELVKNDLLTLSSNELVENKPIINEYTILNSNTVLNKLQITNKYCSFLGSNFQKDKVPFKYLPWVYESPKGWELLWYNSKTKLEDICQILYLKKYKIYPENDNIFKAFYLCEPKDIKVVILDKTPYCGRSNNGNIISTGLAYSVDTNCNIPIYMQNIFKELKRSIPDFNIPNHGDLTSWAKQGVFLLNNSLTTSIEENHGALWEGFINEIIELFVKYLPNIIYVLWGREIEKFKSKLPVSSKILITSHPDGRSAHLGFNNCNHFVDINTYLVSINNKPINWNL